MEFKVRELSFKNYISHRYVGKELHNYKHTYSKRYQRSKIELTKILNITLKGPKNETDA